MSLIRTQLVYDDLESLSSAAAQRIAELAAESIAARGIFRLALAGGETPRRCYEKLRQLPVDWSRAQVFFGDERCLPAGDAQRNDTMARATLLDQVAATVFNIPAELGPEAAAACYAKTLGDEPLDLVLLGMGEDGHTASLFPHNPATLSSAAVVAVFNSPKPPSERVSLGMTTLNRSRHKLLLVAGAGKRQAMQYLAKGVTLPVTAIEGAEWHVSRDSLPNNSID